MVRRNGCVCPRKASAMCVKRALGSCASRLAMSVWGGIPQTGQTHAGRWDCGNVLECFANIMNQEDLLAARFVIGGEETNALVLTVVITKVSSLVTPRAFKLGRATEENATRRKETHEENRKEKRPEIHLHTVQTAGGYYAFL